jgi:hypothetical protein
LEAQSQLVSRSISRTCVARRRLRLSFALASVAFRVFKPAPINRLHRPVRSLNSGAPSSRRKSRAKRIARSCKCVNKLPCDEERRRSPDAISKRQAVVHRDRGAPAVASRHAVRTDQESKPRGKEECALRVELPRDRRLAHPSNYAIGVHHRRMGLNTEPSPCATNGPTVRCPHAYSTIIAPAGPNHLSSKHRLPVQRIAGMSPRDVLLSDV